MPRRSLIFLAVLSVLFFLVGINFGATIIASNTAKEYTTQVLVVADEEFQNRWGNQWQTQAKAIIEQADNAFQDQFDINLSVPAGNYAGWQSTDDKSLEQLLFEVKKQFPRPRGQIVIAFTGQFDAKYRGFALPRSGVVIVQDEGIYEDDWITLQHEISHLFGVDDHQDYRTCLMAKEGYRYPGQWCPECKFLIKQNRQTWLYR